MTTILLIIHLFVTLALIGVVLIQRSEGGGLGIGTAQGMGSFMSGRGTANLLTRATAVLATIFMLLSLTLALLNRGTTGVSQSILDVPSTSSAPALPAGGPAPGSVAPGTGAPGSVAPGGASGGGTPGTAAPGAAAPGAAAPGTGTTAPGTQVPATQAPASGPSVPTN